MTENLELRHQVFEKMGYVPPDNYCGEWGHESGDIETFVELPPIETTWEVTAKYLVPFMLEKGYGYEIDMEPSDGYLFYWSSSAQDAASGLIINHDHALAACEAFMEVEL